MALVPVSVVPDAVAVVAVAPVVVTSVVAASLASVVSCAADIRASSRIAKKSSNA